MSDKTTIKYLWKNIIKPDGIHSLIQRIERIKLKCKKSANNREYI